MAFWYESWRSKRMKWKVLTESALRSCLNDVWFNLETDHIFEITGAYSLRNEKINVFERILRKVNPTELNLCIVV